MYSATTATRKVSRLTKRIRAIQGGTSASKTISVLLYLIHEAQTDEEPTLTSIVSESIPHLKRGAMRDFKKIMQTHGYWKDSAWNATDSIYTYETGSQIEFFSTDNGDKLRGGRRDRAFMNEANNCTFDAIILDWNPSSEFWYNTELEGKRDDIEFIILTYKDNEALDAAIVASIEQRRGRKGWWKVYGEGQLGEIEGKIYKGWVILDEIPEGAKLMGRGLDFGYTNDPTSIVDIYKFNGGYIWDEIVYMKGMSNKQIADVLKSLEPTLIVADSSEPKSIDEIAMYGLNIIGAKKGPDSVNNGIQAIQAQQMSVTKRSVNIIQEYRNYLWVVDRNGKVLNVPEDKNNHAMDAGRYGMSMLNLIEVVYSESEYREPELMFPDIGI
jgi:phage terminase large subunit